VNEQSKTTQLGELPEREAIMWLILAIVVTLFVNGPVAVGSTWGAIQAGRRIKNNVRILSLALFAFLTSVQVVVGAFCLAPGDYLDGPGPAAWLVALTFLLAISFGPAMGFLLAWLERKLANSGAKAPLVEK
jgi:hypothetical protein